MKIMRKYISKVGRLQRSDVLLRKILNLIWMKVKACNKTSDDEYNKVFNVSVFDSNKFLINSTEICIDNSTTGF